ncbi:hypothetical protein AUJ14_02160 [Candidatus Micrarchaeota archaeon CG1_02_55_22]|nr:MAG: hypothetical protein AUJ14_02160 [Candidatus Micrarchaeota archaeon CG1_02_55_22]
MVFLKAVILVGGYATRLMPLSLRIPKVMVPVAGKPGLEHLVQACKNAEIHDVVISLNSNQKVIEEYFGDGSKWGVQITYVYEDSMSDEDKFGAIGAIEYTLKKTGMPEECLILNGDNIFYGLDLKRLKHAHAGNKGHATLALYTLEKKSEVELFSAVQVDEKGRIMRFQEKPKLAEAVSNLASVGIYHVGRPFLEEHLPEFIKHRKIVGKKADSPGTLWQHFVEKAELYGHAFTGTWGDTNTPETYVDIHKASMTYLVGNELGGDYTVTEGGKVAISPDAKISSDAIIHGPAIIDSGCEISAGAVIGPGAHLMKGVKVGEGAAIMNSIVFRDAQIGSKALVNDAIIDLGASVGSGAVMEEYSILGFKAKLGTKSKMLSKTRAWPFVEIGEDTVVGGTIRLPEELFKNELAKEPLY